MESFLEKVQKLKSQELKDAPSQPQLDNMRERLTMADRRFMAALCGENPCIIAEFKPASPSAGVINDQRTVTEVVIAYKDAAAISVLTDSNFFGSNFERLAEVRAVTDKPLLCKDFVVSRFQVYRARECGADAVLLIVKLLDQALLADLFAEISALGMVPVVEVQTEEELRIAEELNSEVLLINNRNLDTLEMDLGTTAKLAPLVRNAKHVVAASGVETTKDIEALKQHARIFLIGSALMKSAQPADTLRQFLTAAKTAVVPKIKLCGFQRLEDATAAGDLGVDYLGLIFVEESRRRVTVQDAELICRALKGKVKLVGVFRDSDVEYVNEIAERLELDMVQYHGSESREQCRRTVRPVIKVFELDERFDAQQLDQYRDCVAHFLFDRPKNSKHRKWLNQAISVLSRQDLHREFFIAGGLDESNVAEAIGGLKPFAVDAASSVETSPGLKDTQKMTRFVQTVRGVAR